MCVYIVYGLYEKEGYMYAREISWQLPTSVEKSTRWRSHYCPRLLFPQMLFGLRQKQNKQIKEINDTTMRCAAMDTTMIILYFLLWPLI